MTCEALRRERLVQLDEVEIARLDAGPREHLAHGGHRPDAHDPRVDAGDGARRRTVPAAPRRARAAFSALAIDEGGRAVVDAARVPGGDRAVRAKRGLERGELLDRRVRARMLVARRRRRPARARRRTGLPRRQPRAAAGSRARRRPAPPATRRSARRRSRRSRPSTRAGTSPPGAGSGSASRASCPRAVWLPRGNARSGLPMTSGARLIDSTPPATKSSPSPARPRGRRRRPRRARTRRAG